MIKYTSCVDSFFRLLSLQGSTPVACGSTGLPLAPRYTATPKHVSVACTSAAPPSFSPSSAVLQAYLSGGQSKACSLQHLPSNEIDATIAVSPSLATTKDDLRPCLGQQCGGGDLDFHLPGDCVRAEPDLCTIQNRSQSRTGRCFHFALAGNIPPPTSASLSLTVMQALLGRNNDHIHHSGL